MKNPFHLLSLAVLSAAGCCFAEDPYRDAMKTAAEIKNEYQKLLAGGGRVCSKNEIAEGRKIMKRQLLYPVLYRPGKKFTGNLKDWQDIPFAGKLYPAKATIRYPKNLAAEFKACITDNDLYFLFVARDSVKVFDEIPGHYYTKDCFELFLDPLLKRTPDSDDSTSQTFVTPRDPSCKVMLCSGKVPMEAKYIPLPEGWAAEVKVPLNNRIFSIRPFNGLRIGFNLTYCNNDTPGKMHCHGKLNWSILDVAGESYKVPAVLGYLQIVMNKTAEVKAAQAGPECRKSAELRAGGETLKDLSLIEKNAKTLPLTRGFNGRPDREVFSWGANNLRFSVVHREEHLKQPWDKAIDLGFPDLEKALLECRRNGSKAILTLGRVKNAYGQVWKTPETRRIFMESWKKAIRLLKPYKDVVWVDLLNEPLELTHLPYAPKEYRPFMVKVIKEIRKIDKDIWLIYEVGPGGGWRGFEDLKPLPDPRIIYSLHFYIPGVFTHQGVNAALLQDRSLISKAQKGNQMKYPGYYSGEWFDKNTMERQLCYAIDFQKKYKAPIYVGEFSVTAWTDPESAVRWLEDAISIFEEYGWSWSYHCWKGWIGWNLQVEDGVLIKPKRSNSSRRAAVIRKALEKNRKTLR